MSSYQGMLASKTGAANLNQSLLTAFSNTQKQTSQLNTSAVGFGTKDAKSSVAAESTTAVIALLKAKLQNIACKPTASSLVPRRESFGTDAALLRTSSVSNSLFQTMSTNTEAPQLPAVPLMDLNDAGTSFHVQNRRPSQVPVPAFAMEAANVNSLPPCGPEKSNRKRSADSLDADFTRDRVLQSISSASHFEAGMAGGMPTTSFLMNSNEMAVSTNALRRVRKRARSILKNDRVPRDAKRKTKGCALSRNAEACGPGAEA
mmetsp:Transcript_20547/g.41652  ORF Transcript_20547/g.41652 Transcript_20547/m.41652 type:complete len:261 (+) Transcript_20547:19-801(+)